MKRASVLLALALAACSKASPAAAPGPSAVPSSASSTSAPASDPAEAAPRATDHFSTRNGDLAVTPLEHASVLITWAGKSIYVDPTATATSAPSLPKADVVFVTDIHGDHMDAPALTRLRKPGTVVVGPPAVADRVQVDVALKNGETREVAGIGVTAVAMYNLKRGPNPGQLFHDKGRGDGYVLDFAGTRVYLSGDTECTPEMKALEHIDVAFVCMNLPYTMPPAEAAECIAAFKPKVLFPYHYRGSDLGELDRALAGKGVEIRVREWYAKKGP